MDVSDYSGAYYAGLTMTYTRTQRVSNLYLEPTLTATSNLYKQQLAELDAAYREGVNSIWTRKKNIPFDADEMMVLIEAAVQEMNEVFQKATEQQLPVKAGDYVGPQDSGEAEKVPAEMA